MATKPAPRKPAAPPPAKPAATPQGAAASAAPAKPAKRGGVLKLLLVLLLVGAAGGGAWFYLGYSGAQAKSPAPEPKKQLLFVPLEQFTVNLTTVTIDRYLQVGITLEVSSESAAAELKRQTPVIRSRILLLLASKTAEELATKDGKQKLVTDLLAEARAPLAAMARPAKAAPATPAAPADPAAPAADGQAPAADAPAAPAQTFGVENVHFTAFVIQ